MLQTKLPEIGPPLPEKIFERFLVLFTIYGHSSHLGHVTRLMLIVFISMYLKAYIQNFVKNGPVVSDKRQF